MENNQDKKEDITIDEVVETVSTDADNAQMDNTHDMNKSAFADGRIDNNQFKTTQNNIFDEKQQTKEPIQPQYDLQYTNQRYQWQPPQKTPETKSKKRIGTFTMGVSLIVTGLAVTYSLLNPNFDYILLIKFTPLLLVLLGVEVIIFSLFSKAQRLRYDFLSGLICFLIICGSVLLGSVPILYKELGPDRYIAEQKLEKEISSIYKKTLSNINGVSSVNVTVGLEPFINKGGYDKISSDNFNPYNSLGINIDINEEFKNKKAFTDYCVNLLSNKKVSGIKWNDKVDWINVSNADEEKSYIVWLDKPFVNMYDKKHILDSTYEYNHNNDFDPQYNDDGQDKYVDSDSYSSEENK